MKNNIRAIRKDRDLTQEQLANMVNTTKTQISKLEKAQRRLTDDWMKRLAKALECHWIELVGESDPITEDEKAILGLYRGFSDAQKEYAHRLVATLQDPTDQDGPTNHINQKDPHKKAK